MRTSKNEFPVLICSSQVPLRQLRASKTGLRTPEKGYACTDLLLAYIEKRVPGADLLLAGVDLLLASAV